MKREIEFRAKNINDQWRYGYLERQDLLYDENYDCSSTIQIETLGQYIGLKDKTGKKIYEGDVVKFIDYDSYDEGFENAGVVKYGGNMFYVTNRYSLDMEDLVDDLEGFMYCEVIGNIHDDPEMWEEYDEKPNN